MGLVPNGAGGRVPFGIRGMPRPTGAAQAVHSNGPMYLRHGLRRQNFRTKFGASVRSSCPTGGCGEPPRLPWVAAHSGAFALRMGGMGGSRSRDHPKSAYQRRTIPRLAYGCQLPLHKGALGDGGCGSPRRFAPCNDSPKPLSFRGGPTGRRGNPSFLRWTGVRAAEVVGPYGRSTEVPATGRCGHRPLRNEVGSCRDCRGSALSAERVAGQSQSLPDDLRVQHGVQRSEVSAKPRPCSRRGCGN